MLGLRPDEKGIKPSYNFIAGGPMAAAPQNGVAALSQIRADRCYNKRSVKRQAMIVKRMPLPHEATRVSKDFGERRPRRARSSRRAVGAAAAQADQKAFEASFQQHYARVYNLLFRLVGNRAEAEDLALEVFSRLWERAPAPAAVSGATAVRQAHGTRPERSTELTPKSVEGEHLGGWLYRVAMNLGFNALRSARRRSHYETISYENSAGAASASGTAGALDPAQAAELADERAQVQAALRQMKPRDAQILVLRHSGLSYKEIAAALEIAPGSVGTLLARAERAFEQVYEDHAPVTAGR